MTLCKPVKYFARLTGISAAWLPEWRHGDAAADQQPFHPFPKLLLGLQPTRFPLDSHSSREGGMKTVLVLHMEYETQERLCPSPPLGVLVHVVQVGRHDEVFGVNEAMLVGVLFPASVVALVGDVALAPPRFELPEVQPGLIVLRWETRRTETKPSTRALQE